MNQAVDASILHAVASYQPKLAILFGSRARGDQDKNSDIDLLLVKATQDTFFERLKKFALMVPKGAPRVDAFIYTPEEFTTMKEWEIPVIMRALQEGKCIYEAPN